MAIVIVMVSIFVLSVLAAGFAMSMKVETRLALNANYECQMEWLGRSGIEKARQILGRTLELPNSGQLYDSLNQGWAGGNGETNEGILEMCTDVEVAPGMFIRRPIITDAERKFNINLSLTEPTILERALILIGADSSEVPTIISSVQDWIDRDENKHLSGAESDYYSHLERPYNSKNGPLDDLTELMMIKGVSPEMYWGPNSISHPTSLLQPKRAVATGRPAGAPTVNAGLVDLFTPVSSGLLNINTASATTLQVLGIDQQAAERLVSLRSGPDGVDGNDDDIPFTNTGEIINAVPNQALVQQIMRYLTIRSYTFEVKVLVEIGDFHRTYHALIRRNSARDLQVMNVRWEE